MTFELKSSTVMRVRLSIATIFVSTALLFTMPAAARRSARWQTINAEGLFTFRLPAGFKQTGRGIDTFMREYGRGRARFIFVCGDSASDEYDEKTIRRVHEAPVTIDGKRASIRTFEYTWKRTPFYVTELNVGDWRAQHVELYMGLESPNRADMQLAQQIFRSVKFLKSGCS